MGHEEAPRLTVVQPGEGREGTLGSIGVVFKLLGEDTNQQLGPVTARLCSVQADTSPSPEMNYTPCGTQAKFLRA